MNLNEYQARAHSTAVHGGTLAYPLAAIAEEVGEVQSVWADWVRNAEYLNVDYDTVKAKLLDEIGDVCWNIAELLQLLNIPLEYVDSFSTSNHVTNSVMITYYVCQLGMAAGRINGTWAKYIRKHGGVQPTTEEVAAQELLPNSQNMKGALCGNCILLLHAVHNLTTRLEIDFNEVLEHNLKKLADRKLKNTLGGVGSVDTRSSL